MCSKFRYLRGDHIISHIPETMVQVRRVGEGIASHLGGDNTDHGVCLLVGLLHYTHISGRFTVYTQ